MLGKSRTFTAVAGLVCLVAIGGAHAQDKERNQNQNQNQSQSR